MKNSLEEILERIKKAATNSKFHRDETDVKLLAVSKKQPVDKIQELFEQGQRFFAENYVQELLQKKEQLINQDIQWHMIGPLQTNKVSKIIGKIELIHSVDSLKLAEVISEKSKEQNVIQKILLQINTSGETSKSGLQLDTCYSVIGDILKLKNIEVRGLMTMPPFTDNPELSRSHFKILRKIRDDFKNHGLKELSMGTTQDFEVAIMEGATIIRVGEALFGPRGV